MVATNDTRSVEEAEREAQDLIKAVAISAKPLEKG